MEDGNSSQLKAGYPCHRMKKLNLGCGYDKKEGYLNVDINDWDLNKFPYPWKNDFFSEVLCYSALEHLDNPNKTMQEILRITKNKGMIKIIVPHFSGCAANGMGHKTFFRYRDFEYRKTGIDKEYLKNFKIIKRRIIFDKKLPYNWLVEPVANLFPKVYENTFLRCLFPAYDLFFVLKKLNKWGK